MKRLNLYITTPQAERLAELSEKDGTKRSEHVRRALDIYLGSLGLHTFDTKGWKKFNKELDTYE